MNKTVYLELTAKEAVLIQVLVGTTACIGQLGVRLYDKLCQTTGIPNFKNLDKLVSTNAVMYDLYTYELDKLINDVHKKQAALEIQSYFDGFVVDKDLPLPEAIKAAMKILIDD